jgi:hypothetical protein
MAPETRDHDGTPILLARRKAGRLIVWCVYCRREHWHGTEAGHRIAHCTDKASPYRLTGYLLRVAPQRGQAGHLGYLTVKGFTP